MVEIRRALQQRLPATGRYVASQANLTSLRLEEAINSSTQTTEKIQSELITLANQQSTFSDSLAAKYRESDAKYSRLTSDLENLKQQLKILEYCNLEYLGRTLTHSKSNVLLAGWYGAENCGDELMMRTILQYLREVGIRPTILLWDYPEYDATDLFDQAEILHYPTSTWHLHQLADLYDVLIWGGGAIIDENQYDSDPFNINTGNLLIRLSELMLIRQKSVYALGLSSNNSISNSEYLTKLKHIVTNSKVFSLRDENSLETLMRAGIAEDKLKFMLDPVFACKELANQKDAYSHFIDSNEPLIIGMVFVNFADLVSQHIDIIQQTSAFFSEQNKNFKIRLIPFFGYRDADLSYYEHLYSQLGEPKWLSFTNYSHHLADNPIFGCDFVISYRYHGTLLAGAAGIPNISICLTQHSHYANKMYFLAKQLNAETMLIDSQDYSFDNIRLALNDLLNGKTKLDIPTDLFVSAQAQLLEICQRVSLSQIPK